MEGVPVIDETYREIMEDVMDIKNAQVVLRSIESGEVKVRAIDYTSTPSPFAHNAILAGISDMVLMEDRGALLRELHRQVLSKVMGSEISEFEFTEEQVVPYFRKRLGIVTTKEELLSLIRRAAPIRVLKEKGRNVYPYTIASRERSTRGPASCIEEGAIASVYIDDAYFVPTEDLPTYHSVLSRDRALGRAGGGPCWKSCRTRTRRRSWRRGWTSPAIRSIRRCGSWRRRGRWGASSTAMASGHTADGRSRAGRDRRPWTRCCSATWSASPRPRRRR